jgi:hypothetical protein
MVPAVNEKLVVVAPAATAAELGRVSMPAGLAETVRSMPPAGAGFESVAVQYVEFEDISDVLAQTREDRVSGPVIVRLAVLLEPLRVAVMVGV